MSPVPPAVLVVASPVDNLLNSSQGPNTESSAISVAIASDSTTVGQAQEFPQVQGPPSNNFLPYMTSLNAKRSDVKPSVLAAAAGSDVKFDAVEAAPHMVEVNPVKELTLTDADSTTIHVSQPEGPPSNAVYPSPTDPNNQHPASNSPVLPVNNGAWQSTAVAKLIDPDPTGPHVPVATSPLNADISANSTGISVGVSKSVQSLPKVSRSSIPAVQPSSATESSNLPTSITEMVDAPGLSAKLSYTVHPSTKPPVGAHVMAQPVANLIIPTTSNYQGGFLHDQSLSLGSSPPLGSRISMSAQALQTFITQVLHNSDYTASLLFRPTATPSISKQPSPLTISGQTVTVNSLGQYSIENQTLTPGGVITVSGSKISLALNASDLIIGTSTEALGPSVTASLGSGSNGTEVQKFTGYALGARDGLWSSSMMLLVSFLLLLWI